MSETPVNPPGLDTELIRRLTDRTASDPVLKAQIEALKAQVESMQKEKADAERSKADAEVTSLRTFRDKAKRLFSSKDLTDEDHATLMQEVFKELGATDEEIESMSQPTTPDPTSNGQAAPNPRGGQPEDPARRLMVERLEAEWKDIIKKGVTENPTLSKLVEAHKKKGTKAEAISAFVDDAVEQVYLDAQRLVKGTVDKGGKVSYDLLKQSAAKAVSGFSEKAQWWSPGGEGLASSSEADPVERLRALMKKDPVPAPRYDPDKQAADPSTIDREFDQYALDALSREIAEQLTPASPGSAA